MNTGTLYIASTLDNFERVRKLRDHFASVGIGLTFDWTTQNEGRPTASPGREEVAALNELIGVLRADCVLAVMPGRNGTHFEMGAALVLQKPIILLNDTGEPLRTSFHYLRFITKCTDEQVAIAAVLDKLRRPETHPRQQGTHAQHLQADLTYRLENLKRNILDD